MPSPRAQLVTTARRPPRARAALAACVALLAGAWAGALAAEPQASVVLGVGNQVVAGAWNPLRVVTRDLPASTFTAVLDVGTLRGGAVDVTITHELPGGGGVHALETDLFVPPFRSVAWRVVSGDRVVASGSLGSRDSDERPLALLLQERGAALPDLAGAAGWPDARLVEVAPSDLPVTPAAYGGVVGLIVDHPAPPLEALVAAAVAGVKVVLLEAPAAYPAPVAGLVGERGAARLGAGWLVAGAARGAPATGLVTVRPLELLTAALAEPLVAPPEPVPFRTVLIGAAVYAAALLVLLRFGGQQGLISAVLVAGLAGALAWALARPAAAQFEGGVAVGVVGGPLALVHEARERLTLPSARLEFEPTAAPALPRGYDADDRRVSIPTDAWRNVIVWLPPRAVASPLTVSGTRLVNVSAAPLVGVYVVGLGAQPDVAPGAVVTLAPGEEGAFPPTPPGVYAALTQLLPAGTVLATSGCESGACVVWLADTDLGGTPGGPHAGAGAAGSGAEP